LTKLGSLCLTRQFTGHSARPARFAGIFFRKAYLALWGVRQFSAVAPGTAWFRQRHRSAVRGPGKCLCW